VRTVRTERVESTHVRSGVWLTEAGERWKQCSSSYCIGHLSQKDGVIGMEVWTFAKGNEQTLLELKKGDQIWIIVPSESYQGIDLEDCICIAHVAKKKSKYPISNICSILKKVTETETIKEMFNDNGIAITCPVIKNPEDILSNAGRTKDILALKLEVLSCLDESYADYEIVPKNSFKVMNPAQVIQCFLRYANNTSGLSVSPIEKNEKTTWRNRLLFGAPGTGKSHILETESKVFEDNIKRVTFFSDYSYSKFFGTYKPRPIEVNGEIKITYEFVPGPFMQIYAEAIHDENNEYLLIIEELNRARADAVFGELFQLLDRNKEGYSKYPVDNSKEAIEYLECEGEKTSSVNDSKKLHKRHYEKLSLPPNLFIWATMNSADQGVFPLDTAFKRRWHFEYIGIDQGEDDLTEEYAPFAPTWNLIRKKINEKLRMSLKVNEDKLMGPFFLSSNELESLDEFFEALKCKVFEYLYDDAARLGRGKLNGYSDDASYMENQYAVISAVLSELQNKMQGEKEDDSVKKNISAILERLKKEEEQNGFF